jgi:DNA-binding phage protein
MAAYLETEEDIAAYMTEALASGEAAVVVHALGVVAAPAAAAAE